MTITTRYKTYFALFLVYPMDYDPVSVILAFSACDTRQCIEILVENDMITEMTESFFITLERTSGLNRRITLDPVETEIEITNNDGNYRVPGFFGNYS